VVTYTHNKTAATAAAILKSLTQTRILLHRAGIYFAHRGLGMGCWTGVKGFNRVSKPPHHRGHVSAAVLWPSKCQSPSRSVYPIRADSGTFFLDSPKGSRKYRTAATTTQPVGQGKGDGHIGEPGEFITRGICHPWSGGNRRETKQNHQRLGEEQGNAAELGVAR